VKAGHCNAHLSRTVLSMTLAGLSGNATQGLQTPFDWRYSAVFSKQVDIALKGMQ